MSGGILASGRLIRPALRLLVGLAALASLTGDAWAQIPTATPTLTATATATVTPTLLTGGQGPRSPFVGPSAAPPDAEGPPRDASLLPPGRSARCRWDLGGSWTSSGRQTDPTASTYTGGVTVRQFGNYLVLTRSGEPFTYYGVCSGDRLELDAYSGDQLVGAYTGTVSANGRRIESTWVHSGPEYRAGYETLTSTR